MNSYWKWRFVNRHLKPWLKRALWMGAGAVIAVSCLPLYPNLMAKWVDMGQDRVLDVASIFQGPGAATFVHMEPQDGELRPGSQVTVEVEVEPINLLQDTPYHVALMDIDGFLLDTKKVSWSLDDLLGPDPGERNARVIETASSRKNKRLTLEIPSSDKSVAPLLQDIRSEYERKALADIKSHVRESEQLGLSSFGALLTASEFELSQKEIDDIVSRHLDVVLVDDNGMKRIVRESNDLGRAR